MNDFTIIYECQCPEGVIYDATVKVLREVFNATEENISLAYSNQSWAKVRKTRDKLIGGTDWTQNEDIPVGTRDLWKPYRQELRDVTDQSDPNNITWPTKP